MSEHEESGESSFKIDDAESAIEQRQHYLAPMAMALNNVTDLMELYRDADFQRALDYNSHIPVSDGLRELFTEHIEMFQQQTRGLLLVLRGSHIPIICPGDAKHGAHLAIDLSAMGEQHLDDLEEDDPDEHAAAMSDPFGYDWPWFGQITRNEVVVEQAATASAPSFVAPLITAEQTIDQIKALRDDKHQIHVVVPVPFARMDENNEFSKLEELVEDFIGGDTLILTQVTLKPVGVHGTDHILVEVQAVADFTFEIGSFGETGHADPEQG